MPGKYQTVTQSASGTSDWILMDPGAEVFAASVHAEQSGTNTYSVEVTLVPTAAVDSSVDAVALANMTGLTASNIKTLLTPVAAVRVNITSYTNGSVILHVRQGG